MEKQPLWRTLVGQPAFAPFILFVIEVLVFWSLNPFFLSPLNISNILAFTVEIGLLALAMTLLMTAGEFDLSVGSVFGLAPVVMWALFNSSVMPLPVAFLCALLVGVAIGLVNGLLTTRLKIPSFLVTLGMLLVARGSALYVTHGFPQHAWDATGVLPYILAGVIEFGGYRIHMSLFWFIAAALLAYYILNRSKAGNWIQASGGNPDAARARGVKVDRTKVYLFVVSAVVAALAGIMSSFRVAAANPNSGTGYELQVIAMVVVGGTALMGGRGTIAGTILGTFLLRAMRSGLVLIGVPGLAFKIFIGGIILGMMALHSKLEKRKANMR